MTNLKVSEPTRIEIETWLVEIAEYMEGGLGWTKSDERMANAIRALILEHGRLMKAIEAAQQALMAAEKLAMEFLRLKKKLGEWKERADNLLYSALEREPWMLAASKFLNELRDLKLDGEEGK